VVVGPCAQYLFPFFLRFNLNFQIGSNFKNFIGNSNNSRKILNSILYF
jgi:hypothetical protein